MNTGAALHTFRSRLCDTELDVLTRVRNREGLMRYLRHCTRHTQHVTLIAIDLNRFKWVNLSAGVHVGDGVLQRTAERLLAIAPPDAVVARLGSDEFGVVIRATERTDTLSAAILATLREAFHVDGCTVMLSACVGIADSRTAGSPESLLQASTLALSYAERDGFGCQRTYDPRMRDTVLQSIAPQNAA